MSGYEANTSRPPSPLRRRTQFPAHGADYSYLAGGRSRVFFAALPESSSEERRSSLSRRGNLTDLYSKWISDGPAPGLTASTWPYHSSGISSYVPSARKSPSSYSSYSTSSSSTSPYSSLSSYTPSSSLPYSSLSTYTPSSSTSTYITTSSSAAAADPGPTWGEYYTSRLSRAGSSTMPSSKGKGVDYRGEVWEGEVLV
jgi:hypothetical protein